MNATPRQSPFDASVSAASHAPVERAEFEAFFAEWFPRVHRFASTRLADPREAEASTRATLEAAVRAGLAAERAGVAPRLLALALAAVDQTQGHSCIRHTNAPAISAERCGSSTRRS